tara:strand:- start:288 stop:557 length:270 start_codon:yes stop_codon:yes gene_type:complete
MPNLDLADLALIAMASFSLPFLYRKAKDRYDDWRLYQRALEYLNNGNPAIAQTYVETRMAHHGLGVDGLSRRWDNILEEIPFNYTRSRP